MATHTRREDSNDGEGPAQRLDRWLWFSRIAKSRSAAAQLISKGKVRVNRARVIKPSQSVRAGDVLTIALRGKVRILRILGAAHRRGPPREAQQFFQVIEPGDSEGQPASPLTAESAPDNHRRPGKRDRRWLEPATDK